MEKRLASCKFLFFGVTQMIIGASVSFHRMKNPLFEGESLCLPGGCQIHDLHGSDVVGCDPKQGLKKGVGKVKKDR